MKLLTIVLKDALSELRSAFTLFMALVAPLLVSGLMYLAFGGLGKAPQLTAVRLAVVDLDQPAGGLRLVEKGGSRGVVRAVRPLLKAFLDPSPRLELGATLGERRLASAMIDLSDGLSVDLAHICRESGVGAAVEAERVPISAALDCLARDPLAMALDGGEDYELLFTVRPAKTAAVEALVQKHRLTRIGVVTKGRTIALVGPGKKRRPLRVRGFEHFTG